MELEFEIYIEDGKVVFELINDDRITVALGTLDLNDLKEALDGELQ